MHLPKSGRIPLVQFAFLKYTKCGAVLCLVQSVNRAFIKKGVFLGVPLVASFSDLPYFDYFLLYFAITVKNAIHAWSYDYHGMVSFV